MLSKLGDNQLVDITVYYNPICHSSTPASSTENTLANFSGVEVAHVT